MLNRIIHAPLHWQILVALILAVAAGFLAGTEGALGGIVFYDVFQFVGTLFINALKMIIVPLIVSSIIVGVAGIGGEKNLGRVGGLTMLFYAASTMLAILVGLVLINLVEPGVIDGTPQGDALGLDQGSEAVREQIGEGGSLKDLVGIFERMIPTNVVQAAANAELLAVIFFALLFGFFMARSEHDDAELLYRFWNGVFHVMMAVTTFVMRFAPIGVFGLVAAVVAETGFEAAGPLLLFSATVLVALAIHVFGTMPLFLKLVAKVSPYRMFRIMAPALLTAFSTASSSATLPVTMDCVERQGKVSNKISSFVLPLGATVNMNGTALYECMAAIFLAQAYGLELTLVTQFVIVVTALVTSIGVAGVPSASLVAIGIILTAIGLPLEALGVLFVFDRILDMARTSVNVFGDSVCAVMVASLTGEKGLLDPEAEQNR